MPNALVDKYSKKELEQIIQSSSSLNEAMKKIGYKCINGNAGKVVKKRLDQYNIDYTHFTLLQSHKEKRTFENSFCKNSTASQNYIKKHYKKYYTKKYCCDICGLSPMWNGKKLILHLDHINGDHHDNRLENLRWVCPNCHSQTDSYAGRNRAIYTKQIKNNYCVDCGVIININSKRCNTCQSIKNRKVQDRPDRETLKQLIKIYPFTKIGKEYSVSDNTIRKWCKKYNLPSTKKEINSYSDEEWINI